MRFEIIEKSDDFGSISELTLVISHYHYRSGGVRRVIENCVTSLINTVTEKRTRVLFIYGNKSGINQFKRWLLPQIPKNFEVVFAWIPEIDYNSTQFTTRENFLSRSGTIQAKFYQVIKRFSKDGPVYLIFHNLSLGKNIPFCHAIKMVASDAYFNGEKFFFFNQIHDFAEDQRWNNLSKIINCTGQRDIEFATKMMYPYLPNFYFGVINKTAYQSLMNMGIPRRKVFYIPNCITIPQKPTRKTDRLRSQFLFIRPKVLLAPVRVIRRKNLWETILLKVICWPKDRLLISLGASDEEKYLEEDISQFVRKYHPFVSIGTDNSKFDSLYESADFILSTSISEGFGFVFLESLIKEKVLLGRFLKTSADFKLPYKQLYERFNVPMQWIPLKKLVKTYWEGFNRILEILNRPQVSLSKFRSEFQKEKIVRGTIDYADLDGSMQKDIILRVLKDDSQKNMLFNLNPTVFKYSQLSPKNDSLRKYRQKILKQYSLRRYGQNLFNIFKKIYNEKQNGYQSIRFKHDLLINRFLNFKELRCLLLDGIK